MICNTELFNDVLRIEQIINILFNAVVNTTDVVGAMSVVGEVSVVRGVSYHSEVIANILSVALI